VTATADGSLVAQPALAVSVADAIGAGDSFTAGYLAARCDGLPVRDRLRWGTVAAACTVTTYGDWEGLPTRAGIEHRLRGASTLR
jgi:2-dehydro-3-deoxygluconokinase